MSVEQIVRSHGGFVTVSSHRQRQHIQGLSPREFGSPALVHSEQSNSSQWYKLTPDANGSYVNGTWQSIAPRCRPSAAALNPMPAGYAPLYFASAGLPDGRMIVEGGEYNNLNAAWTNKGAIYDPQNLMTPSPTLKSTWRFMPRGSMQSNSTLYLH